MNKVIPPTEYSVEFDKLRKNRTDVSYYKYGSAKNNYGEKLSNPIENLKLCIKKFEETHNTEYLVDAGNYCMYGFMYPPYDDAYFRATDSNESAGITGFCVKELEDFNKAY